MSTPNSDIPTVSYVGEGRTLVELLYDPGLGKTALAVARPTGETTVENSFTLPNLDRLTPYGPRNSLLSNGCVLLPSEVVEHEATEVLVQDLKAFLDRHVALSQAFRDIAAYYILLSWVYDAFGELPYLRFRGDYGTGKTRALMTIGTLAFRLLRFTPTRSEMRSGRSQRACGDEFCSAMRHIGESVLGCRADRGRKDLRQ